MTQHALFWVSTPKAWKQLFVKIYEYQCLCIIIHSGQDIEMTNVFFDRKFDKEHAVQI